MANKFLSKKIVIPAVIFFGGLLVASGVLILSNFTSVKLSIASQSSQWTQETGAGISVPACGSSTTGITCQAGASSVKFSWADSSGSYPPAPTGDTYSYCSEVNITVNGSVIASNLPCNGTYTWHPVANNADFSYVIATTHIVVPDDSGGSSSGYVAIPGGHEIASGSFTTPACAPVFDFSISNEGNKSVAQGSSVTNIVTATLLSGTTQPVSFSASGLPTGATASFSPASCSPTCSTVMTINTLGSTPTGSFTVTVQGVAIISDTAYEKVKKLEISKVAGANINVTASQNIAAISEAINASLDKIQRVLLNFKF